jgi:hypothetical protein
LPVPFPHHRLVEFRNGDRKGGSPYRTTTDAYVVIEKKSEWEGCRDGAQAGFGERLKVYFLIGRYWEPAGISGFREIVESIACGGWI